MFKLEDLPFPKDALAPYISQETLEYHHGKHHQAYVTNLNNLLEGQNNQKTLEEIIKTSSGGIFNNAAQVWNHTFYWHSLTPKAKTEPFGKIKSAIDDSFGSFAAFKETFSKAALGQFGSGWAWLVMNNQGKLEIQATSNADCPLTKNLTPILTCDVWEHAYYIDYRNARAKYIESFWSLVNWDFANKNLG